MTEDAGAGGVSARTSPGIRGIARRLWLETFTAAGASSGSSSSSSGAIATARRTAAEAAAGRVRARRGASSAGSSNVGSPPMVGRCRRRRRGRAASSSGDDDGDRSGGVGGGRRLRRVSPAWAPTTVSGDAAEIGAVNRDTQPEDEARGPTIRHSIGTGQRARVNESSFRHGASFDRTVAVPARVHARGGRRRGRRRSTRTGRRRRRAGRPRAESVSGGGVAESEGSKEVSGGESVVVSALRLFALILPPAGTWYMVLVIVDVIEEDFVGQAAAV